MQIAVRDYLGDFEFLLSLAINNLIQPYLSDRKTKLYTKKRLVLSKKTNLTKPQLKFQIIYIFLLVFQN